MHARRTDSNAAPALARRAARENLSVDGLIARYAHGVQSLRKLTPEILAPVDAEAYEKRAASLIEVGAPETLAREAAALASDKVVSFLDGKTPRKVIVVPDRLVNLVA